MTPSPAIAPSRLCVLLDIRHPAAYLALHPVADLARELRIELDLLPLVVPPLLPPSAPGPEDDRGIRHRRYRAEALAREIETYAELQGLVLRDYYRDPDPAALNLAWLWVRERHPERLLPMLEEAFRAYWALELEPSSESAAAALVDAQAGDGSEFLAWCSDDGPAAARSLADERSERGLYGVPCYLVGDEVFLGRQHLPMIRWILEGRTGPGPI